MTGMAADTGYFARLRRGRYAPRAWGAGLAAGAVLAAIVIVAVSGAVGIAVALVLAYVTARAVAAGFPPPAPRRRP